MRLATPARTRHFRRHDTELKMMKFFRTALYFKNVPLLERVVRVVMGVAMAALPLAFGRLAGALPLTVAMGAGIAMTGFVGFCPACYLVGRRLEARRPTP